MRLNAVAERYHVDVSTAKLAFLRVANQGCIASWRKEVNVDASIEDLPLLLDLAE
jgi:hypothetical protein